MENDEMKTKARLASQDARLMQEIAEELHSLAYEIRPPIQWENAGDKQRENMRRLGIDGIKVLSNYI